MTRRSGSGSRSHRRPPPPTSPTLFLLDRLVKDHHPADRIQGRVLTSSDKQAFGFDEQSEADWVVRNLVLIADLAGLPGRSSLFIQGCKPYGYACIHSIDKDLILIVSDYPNSTDEYSEVFLIYNTIDRSLRMIPSMPLTYPSIRTPTVLVARQDDSGSYALVFPGTDAQGQAVLFVSPSSSNSPWSTVKKANLPSQWESDSYFQEVFSFRGRGYWVDLLCGGMYCECRDVLSEDIISVDIKSIHLPAGCKKYLGPRDRIAHARSFRAVGPAGGSVKFVSIDGYLERVDLEDFKVRVWRLTEDMDWAVEYELKLASLREGGEFTGGAMPTEAIPMAPMYPILSSHEKDAIYFALGSFVRGEMNCFPSVPRFMVRVDFCSKTFNCTPLSPKANNLQINVALSRNAEGKLLGLPA